MSTLARGSDAGFEEGKTHTLPYTTECSPKTMTFPGADTMKAGAIGLESLRSSLRPLPFIWGGIAMVTWECSCALRPVAMTLLSGPLTGVLGEERYQTTRAHETEVVGFIKAGKFV